MAFPTPSDLLWVARLPDQDRWLIPLLLDAVRSEWPGAADMAASQLGDDPSARELMEGAIAQAQEILVDQRNASIDDVRRVLMRCFKNAVRRARRRQAKISLWGSSGNLERISTSFSGDSGQVEARLDVAKLLQDTPEDIKHALLLRYGSHASWEDIAAETRNSKDGIRMRCKRELKRLMDHYRLSTRNTKDPQSSDRR
jgi:DNA-directed RNA polymerase specialized sigma24 family protein